MPDNPSDDTQLRQGFMRGVQLMLRLRFGALATAGPPCGSFVFINTGTSKRSYDRPLGDSKREYIRTANKTLGI